MIFKTKPRDQPHDKFSMLSLNELYDRQHAIRKQLAKRDFSIPLEEHRRIRAELEADLNLVNTLIIQKVAEQEAAKRSADHEYIEKAVSENLCDIRYAVNPPSSVSSFCVPVIDCIEWKKPTSPVIAFEYTIKVEEHGRAVKKTEIAEFSLIDAIKPDTFKEMLTRHFQPRSFSVKNQIILVMVV